MLSRLRQEEGFALPLVISLLATFSLLIAGAITFATHSTDRANRDRDAARAFAAADAGLDSAIYRTNKAIFGSQVSGILGLNVLQAALGEVRCVDIDLGQIVQLTPSNGWCPEMTSAEELTDGPVGGGGGSQPAGFSYRVSTGVNLGTSGNPPSHLIERKIVVTGVADDVTKRVMGTVRARVGTAGNLLAVFEQITFVTCTPEPTNPADSVVRLRLTPPYGASGDCHPDGLPGNSPGPAKGAPPRCR